MHPNRSRLRTGALLALTCGLSLLPLALVGCDDDGGGGGDAAAGGTGGGIDGGGGAGGAKSDGAAGTGGSTGDGSATDAPSGVDCTGKPNGTSCAEADSGGAICLANACVTSRCGDGFVDTNAGEQCEDGNEAGGDGCTACRFDCQNDNQCSDGDTCNGTETCDKSVAGKQLCKAGTNAADNTACTLPGSTGAGVCKTGVCVKAGCGNSTVDAGEECDDGNANDADGCTKECKFTCKVNEDCSDGNACNGTETCNTTTHVCANGTAVNCNTAKCNGTCDPATGMCKFADGDMDGSGCNLDCNDADPAMLPGGFECKDTKDNDCDPATADGTAPSCECYPDSDGDGFAPSTTGAIAAPGMCPAKYTRTKPGTLATTDCQSSNAQVNPKQESFFPTSYCKGLGVIGQFMLPTCLGGFSFDYNCNGVEERQNTVVAKACAPTIFGTCTGSGWVTAAPECGKTGTLRTCVRFGKACLTLDQANQTQACR